MLAVLGYVVLLFTPLDPILPLLLIALAQAALPTLILAIIGTHLVNCKATGFAFGVIEALDGVANVVGNLAFGYLSSVTSSYFAGLVCLLLLSCTGLCIFVYLFWEERRSTAQIRHCSGVELQSRKRVQSNSTVDNVSERQSLISESRRSANGSYGIV